MNMVIGSMTSKSLLCFEMCLWINEGRDVRCSVDIGMKRRGRALRLLSGVSSTKGSKNIAILYSSIEPILF